ncbi:MAG: type II toxin-antitoxin system PemK/MazF family toxin [Chloroflexota bacterium]
MVVSPGYVYWVQFTDAPQQTHIPHPHVVIGVDDATVTLCALTTNRRKLSVPGNLLLDAGEAGLPKQSVVEVSKQVTIPYTLLGSYIGALSDARLKQIRTQIAFVSRSFRR